MMLPNWYLTGLKCFIIWWGFFWWRWSPVLSCPLLISCRWNISVFLREFDLIKKKKKRNASQIPHEASNIYLEETLKQGRMSLSTTFVPSWGKCAAWLRFVTHQTLRGALVGSCVNRRNTTGLGSIVWWRSILGNDARAKEKCGP